MGLVYLTGLFNCSVGLESFTIITISRPCNTLSNLSTQPTSPDPSPWFFWGLERMHSLISGGLLDQNYYYARVYVNWPLVQMITNIHHADPTDTRICLHSSLRLGIHTSVGWPLLTLFYLMADKQISLTVVPTMNALDFEKITAF